MIDSNMDPSKLSRVQSKVRIQPPVSPRSHGVPAWWVHSRRSPALSRGTSRAWVHARRGDGYSAVSGRVWLAAAVNGWAPSVAADPPLSVQEDLNKAFAKREKAREATKRQMTEDWVPEYRHVSRVEHGLEPPKATPCHVMSCQPCSPVVNPAAVTAPQ